MEKQKDDGRCDGRKVEKQEEGELVGRNSSMEHVSGRSEAASTAQVGASVKSTSTKNALNM